MIRNARRWLVCVLAIASVAASAPAQSAPLADFDAYVERTMKAFDVPGVAVAVVKDGKVVLARGYGVRKVGDPARVDESTLFGIASNTKAFTTAALSMLAEEGSPAGFEGTVSHAELDKFFRADRETRKLS